MLPCKRSVRLLNLAVVLSLLTACTNGQSPKNLEQSLAADPRLQNNSVVLKNQQTNATANLTADFSKDIPIYPNAKLQESKPIGESKSQLSTRWLSSDPSNLVTSFYRSQFRDNNWQIVQQPTDDLNGYFEVRRNNLVVIVKIKPQPVPNQAATELQLDYLPATNNVANNVANTPQPLTTQSSAVVTSPEFNDLNKLPPQWQQPVQELASLGILSIKSDQSNQFVPNQIITRREYARWLVAANNAMYAKNPAKQIRLASEANQSAFRDIVAKDADFPFIQGLAEAGLIPSSLSGDATAVLFQPDAPLTREQLLLWKVPLDTRQALPPSNLTAVKETWGFQDGGKIDPKALRAVLADFQNGEQANIRRVFGFTTLFQPKKPVTRGEAAVALWYFGTQAEGISASDALKIRG